MQMKGRRADCARNTNRVPSVAAIVASNAGDLVRGAFGVLAPARPARLFMLEAQQA